MGITIIIDPENLKLDKEGKKYTLGIDDKKRILNDIQMDYRPIIVYNGDEFIKKNIFEKIEKKRENELIIICSRKPSKATNLDGCKVITNSKNKSDLYQILEGIWKDLLINRYSYIDKIIDISSDTKYFKSKTEAGIRITYFLKDKIKYCLMVHKAWKKRLEPLRLLNSMYNPPRFWPAQYINAAKAKTEEEFISIFFLLESMFLTNILESISWDILWAQMKYPMSFQKDQRSGIKFLDKLTRWDPSLTL